MGLAARGVETDFRAAAEGHAEGRDDDGARAELDGRGHLLEAADGAIDFVPLAFLRGEQKLHEVGADAEVVAVAGDDEAGEVADGIGVGAENRGDERDDVAADGVLEGVQFDAGDAVAEIDERGAGVAADDACERRKSATRAWPGCWGIGSQAPVSGLKHCGPSGEYQETFGAPGWRAADRRRVLTGRLRVFMRATVSRNAGRIPHLEGAELPVEAGAHGGVDGGRVVGGFADAVGGEVPERREKRPEKARGLVFGGIVGEQHAQALCEGGGVFGHFERGKSGLGHGAVFEGVEVEDEAFCLYRRAPRTFLVEALAGFVAEPAALDDFVEDGGELAAAARPGGKLAATWARMSMPTMSARRKVPVRGQPMAWPVSASTSSMVRPCSSISVAAVNMTATPMRLAMKLGVSLAKTICLPRMRSAKAAKAATTAGSVSAVGMISSRRM